jgi:hypothetical protein
MGLACYRVTCDNQVAIKAQPNLLKYADDLVSYVLSSDSMARFALLVLFLQFLVHAVLGVSLRKRVSNGDFFNVTEGGGSWLDSGYEPLNVKRSSVTVPIMMSDRC